MVRHLSCFMLAMTFTVLEKSSIKGFIDENYNLESVSEHVDE